MTYLKKQHVYQFVYSLIVGTPKTWLSSGNFFFWGGQIYCFANFFCYPNFLLFSDQIFLGGQKSPTGWGGSNCLRGETFSASGTACLIPACESMPII